MNEMRKAFEDICAPSFGHELVYARKKNGEYESPLLEDHWNTFQEGWEAGVEYLKNSKNDAYSDVLSSGGLDPRK